MTEIERLRLTHRLSDHTQAARDLALLRKHDKESAERFAFSTSLHADDILFALTKVASEEDIIANRQVKEDAKAAKEPAKKESEETKEETEEPAKEKAAKKK